VQKLIDARALEGTYNPVLLRFSDDTQWLREILVPAQAAA
jgi:hypothetical protein